MEHLWAPWRMEYIRGKRNEPCIFCAFPARDTRREDLVLCVQEHAFACLNLYPFVASHVLVAPRRHVGALEELSQVEYDATMGLLRETVVRVKRALAPMGFNLGFNLGKAGGAGIADHLHAHVVPRWEGDMNFMPVIADVKVVPEYLEQTWQRLVPFFADLGGA